jgi:hypothetical protein
MQLNKEKIKSYAKTAWKYYANWAYFWRHVKLFGMYIVIVSGLTYGISTLRINISHNSGSETGLEVTTGSLGWPEVCVIILVTIAYIVVMYLMERKPFLSQADADYKNDLDALFNRRMDPIRKLSTFIDRFDGKGAFVNVDNKRVKNVFLQIKNVIDGKLDNLYISAFSGMGKTRWVCEAFKNVQPGDDVYYCDKVDEARFVTSFSALLEENVDKNPIVILDDCDADLYDKFLLEVQKSKCNLRLIGLNNDTSKIPKGVKLISFEYDELEDVVKAIVDVRLADRLKDAYSDTIIKYAEGIPYMAVLLVDSLNKDRVANPNNLSRNALCERMIHLDPNLSRDSQMKAYQTISLFSPLSYEDEDDKQFAFVRDNDNITPIIDNLNRKNLFKQVVGSGIHQQIIERRSSWINVRPSVLAVWMLEDWYRSCDDKRMAAVAQDMVNAPFGRLLVDAFGKRFSDMPDSPSARRLVEEITKAGGSFRSEDVVCSDMGSRLFLAMATVNPVAVSECLHSCMFFKDVSWLKDNVKDDIRRNYVWALEKLCFRKESFDTSAQLLAKLAVAENESWGNNATGIFYQLFHIALAGTQATPMERIQLLEELAGYGEEFNDVIIKALNHLFNYGHFHRTGGAEKVGKKTLPEFCPSGQDVIDYWNMATDFIEKWLDAYPQMVNDVADAIVKQARQIGWAAGCRNILYRLINIVTKIRGDEWPEMAKELIFAEIHHSNVLSDVEKRTLHELIDRLKSKDFISTLDEAHMRFYGDYRDFEQKTKEAESFFAPYVDTFINQNLYNDIEVISKLMDNNQQCDIFFIRQLAHTLNEEQLTGLFKTAIEVFRRNNIKNSSFINLICSHAGLSKAVDSFLEDLKVNKFTTVFVDIISGRETKDLKVLYSLAEEYSGELEWGGLLSSYLRRAPLYDGEQMANTCSYISSSMGDNSDNYIADYIGSYSYHDIIKTQPMLDLVKEFLSRVDEEQLSGNTAFEMNQLAEHLLEDNDLPEFAKQYNLKIIKRSSSAMIHGAYDTIYFSLLPKYEETILDDVLEALADESGTYWLQMMSPLGSGYTSGKGAGPLFQCSHDKIKDFCMKHAKTNFPSRLAHMIPIYAYNESGENDFHEFVYWFLDNLEKFKDTKAILSGIGANMNSFSWIGSIIPLWERQKECFLKLMSHKNPLVRDWAKRNVETLEQEIKSDQRKESYEYFRYS